MEGMLLAMNPLLTARTGPRSLPMQCSTDWKDRATRCCSKILLKRPPCGHCISQIRSEDKMRPIYETTTTEKVLSSFYSPLSESTDEIHSTTVAKDMQQALSGFVTNGVADASSNYHTYWTQQPPCAVLDRLEVYKYRVVAVNTVKDTTIWTLRSGS
ncbi:hypothetical protein OS493_020321 [Desmophyllum pertusum]|uniref:Uncharacterized protein n=1 Tax=Desmophyllum pertusum TaxID=174260 RepID=A0A9X0D3V5_9CNID|nr:hypothetical protein OS493_020321 [Desmophyllum pertusum]